MIKFVELIFIKPLGSRWAGLFGILYVALFLFVLAWFVKWMNEPLEMIYDPDAPPYPHSLEPLRN